MRVILEEHHGAYRLVPVNERIARRLKQQTGESSVLIQLDWDYPHLARSLGWDMRSVNCRHISSDGTVMCKNCGKSVGDFIGEAAEWLNDNLYGVFNLSDPSCFPDLESADILRE